jgi:hypothetical protein
LRDKRSKMNVRIGNWRRSDLPREPAFCALRMPLIGQAMAAVERGVAATLKLKRTDVRVAPTAFRLSERGAGAEIACLN